MLDSHDSERQNGARDTTNAEKIRRGDEEQNDKVKKFNVRWRGREAA